MNDVTELLKLHQVVYVDGFWLADSVDVVSGKIDQHDMLCSVLFRSKKLGSKSRILYAASAMNRRKDSSSYPRWSFPSGRYQR